VPAGTGCALVSRCLALAVSTERRNTSSIALEVVLSTRRVKKGPGRRPQSAKRRRFMELRARGWSISAAAREVGASRTSGANWSRGYMTYRNGQVVGFVAPLDRLAVRKISTRYLSQDERIEIADLHRAGLSGRAIAHQLGSDLVASTVRRVAGRNQVPARPATALPPSNLVVVNWARGSRPSHPALPGRSAACLPRAPGTGLAARGGLGTSRPPR
jgi:Helix-turn-helix domain